MIFQVQSTGEKVDITFKGRLTFADYNSFRQILNLLGTNKEQTCNFDLSDLEFVDSAGLGMLLMAREKAYEVKGCVYLNGASGQVKKMIELGRFDSLFGISR